MHTASSWLTPQIRYQKHQQEQIAVKLQSRAIRHWNRVRNAINHRLTPFGEQNLKSENKNMARRHTRAAAAAMTALLAQNEDGAAAAPPQGLGQDDNEGGHGGPPGPAMAGGLMGLLAGGGGGGEPDDPDDSDEGSNDGHDADAHGGGGGDPGNNDNNGNNGDPDHDEDEDDWGGVGQGPAAQEQPMLITNEQLQIIIQNVAQGVARARGGGAREPRSNLRAYGAKPEAYDGNKDVMEWIQSTRDSFVLNRVSAREQILLLKGALTKATPKVDVVSHLNEADTVAQLEAEQFAAVVNSTFAMLMTKYNLAKPVQRILKGLTRSSIKQKTNEPVQKYRSRIVEKIGQLQAHGQRLSDEVQIAFFANGLQEEPRKHLDTVCSVDTLAEACQAVAAWEESHGTGAGDLANRVAMLEKGQSGGGQQSSKRGRGRNKPSATPTYTIEKSALPTSGAVLMTDTDLDDVIRSAVGAMTGQAQPVHAARVHDADRKTFLAPLTPEARPRQSSRQPAKPAVAEWHSNAKCWVCDKIGHISYHCPMVEKTGGARQPRRWTQSRGGGGAPAGGAPRAGGGFGGRGRGRSNRSNWGRPGQGNYNSRGRGNNQGNMKPSPYTRGNGSNRSGR